MILQTHSPTQGVYPASPDYAHAMEVKDPARFLFISGTMGLRGDGAPGKDLPEQLDLIWTNIRAILASADMDVGNIVRVTSYLRSPDYRQENQDARVGALNGRMIPTTTIVAQTLEDDWLVEIEAIAAS